MYCSSIVMPQVSISIWFHSTLYKYHPLKAILLLGGSIFPAVMKFVFNGDKAILLTAHRTSKTFRGLIKFSINLSLKKCGVVSHNPPVILENMWQISVFISPSSCFLSHVCVCGLLNLCCFYCEPLTGFVQSSVFFPLVLGKIKVRQTPSQKKEWGLDTRH